MGLTKKQIKDMTTNEVDEHCNKIIRQKIEEQNTINGLKNKKS
jgi:hypothetical protein